MRAMTLFLTLSLYSVFSRGNLRAPNVKCIYGKRVSEWERERECISWLPARCPPYIAPVHHQIIEIHAFLLCLKISIDLHLNRLFLCLSKQCQMIKALGNVWLYLYECMKKSWQTLVTPNCCCFLPVFFPKFKNSICAHSSGQAIILCCLSILHNLWRTFYKHNTKCRLIRGQLDTFTAIVLCLRKIAYKTFLIFNHNLHSLKTNWRHRVCKNNSHTRQHAHVAWVKPKRFNYTTLFKTKNSWLTPLPFTYIHIRLCTKTTTK